MKVHKEMFERWKKYCVLFCREHNLKTEDIKSSSMAWAIAFKLEIPREAYHVDPDINDSHIQTALRRIFPNAHL